MHGDFKKIKTPIMTVWGWDHVVNRHLTLPKVKKVSRRRSFVASFLQHERDSSSQKWEAANNGLAISVSFLVNRN